MTITWICCKMHFVLCPNQGYKIKVVFLYRVCILGMFCLKQGQGFTTSVAQLYLNFGRASPRDSVLHPLQPHRSFPFTSSSTVLLPVLVQAILTLNQHLIALLSINQSINKVYLSTVALRGPRMRTDSVWVSFSHSTSVPKEEFD